MEMRFMRYLVVLVILLNVISVSAREIVYTPIPPGFDFPTDEKILLDALKTGNEIKLRTHGWMVFAGLTQPARANDPTSEALWETWYTGEEVFGTGASPQGIRTLKRNLEAPRQFSQPGVVHPQSVGGSQLAFTLFNHKLKEHTRSNNLHLMSKMKSINEGWSAQTPIEERKVEDYPVEAMSLKLVWMPVKKESITPLPIWDEQPIMVNAPSQDSPTWKRRVAVDSSRETIPPNETIDLPGFAKSRVVSLNSFYHFAMDANQASKFPGMVEGDYAVLVAMHYTTKEIPNWVWATFWWHDRPNEGTFAKDRPDETLLKGVWRNYLMDVSYDMDLPKESNGTPNAVFNPWLEAGFKDGVNSNCMTCHQRAVWSNKSPVPNFLPVTRGAASKDDPIFQGGTKADFLWSLLVEGNN